MKAERTTAWVVKCERGCEYKSYGGSALEAEWGMDLHYSTVHWKPLAVNHDDNYVVYN